MRKAYNDTYEARQKLVEDKTAEEAKSFSAARKLLDQKLSEKLAADPEAAAILQQIKAVEAKIEDLREQVRALESGRPAKPKGDTAKPPE